MDKNCFPRTSCNWVCAFSNSAHPPSVQSCELARFLITKPLARVLACELQPQLHAWIRPSAAASPQGVGQPQGEAARRQAGQGPLVLVPAPAAQQQEVASPVVALAAAAAWQHEAVSAREARAGAAAVRLQQQTVGALYAISAAWAFAAAFWVWACIVTRMTCLAGRHCRPWDWSPCQAPSNRRHCQQSRSTC